MDLLTVSFFFFFSPQRPHQKIPGHWPGQAPWQHEGEWISLSDPDGSFPYFIPLVGCLLSEGLRLLMVPISPLQKFMDGAFGLFPQSAWQTSACGRVYLVRIKVNIQVFYIPVGRGARTSLATHSRVYDPWIKSTGSFKQFARAFSVKEFS